MDTADNVEQLAFENKVLDTVEELIKLRDHRGYKFLMVRLAAERDVAYVKLASCDATDVSEVMKLQNAVHRLDWFEATVDEMIEEGLQTETLDDAEDQTVESVEEITDDG